MKRVVETILLTTACLLILMGVLSILATDIISLDTWQRRGLFGDFVGGIIGTIISAIGIIVAGYVAYRVNELQKSLTKQSIQSQKFVAEFQMRNEAFRAYGSAISRALILIGAEGIGDSSRKKILMEELPIVIAAHTFIVSTNISTLLVKDSSLINTGNEFSNAYEDLIAGQSDDFIKSIESASESLGNALASLSEWVISGVYAEHEAQKYDWTTISNN